MKIYILHVLTKNFMFLSKYDYNYLLLKYTKYILFFIIRFNIWVGFFIILNCFINMLIYSTEISPHLQDCLLSNNLIH